MLQPVKWSTASSTRFHLKPRIIICTAYIPYSFTPTSPHFPTRFIGKCNSKKAAATVSSVLLIVRARFRRKTRQVEKPRPVVVCGPAGVGKGTLLDGKLLKEFPNAFAKCVSHTTRAPRKGEVDGVHYHFSEKKAMEKEISRGLFIESANVHGNLYGTSIRAVQDVANQGKICILEIDVQGAQSVSKTTLNPHYLFIKPPSFGDLEKRMRARGSETEETLAKRLKTAKTELDFFESSPLPATVIVNDNLEKAYRELRTFIVKNFPYLTA